MKRVRDSYRATLLDGPRSVAHIIASQKSNGVMSWPACAGAMLALCRGVDPRVLECLSKHVSKNGSSRLGHAAFIGDLPRVQVLLDHGAPLETGAPLAHAVFSGHATVARFLIAAGACTASALDVLPSMPHKSAYRRLASISDSHALARAALLEEMCPAPEAVDSQATASEGGDSEAESDTESDSGSVALDEFRLGVDFGVPALVARHLNAHSQNEYDWEWWINFDWRSKTSKDVIRILASRRPAYNFDWFEVAADLGDVQLVRDLCAADPGYDESAALFAACGVGDLKLVKQLLARDGSARGDYFPPGARRDIVLFFGGQSPWGWERPSLYMAAMNGHVDVVRYVLRWLRNKPLHTNPGQSLVAAIACGLMDEAVALIHSGVDVTKKEEDCHNRCDSYLSVACDVADVDMVRMLLKEGADPNQQFYGTEGSKPIFVAAGAASEFREWKPLQVNANHEMLCREAIVGILLSAGATIGTFGPRSAPHNWNQEKVAAAMALIERVQAGRGGGAAVGP